jgi:hypothetical protein
LVAVTAGYHAIAIPHLLIAPDDFGQLSTNRPHAEWKEALCDNYDKML